MCDRDVIEFVYFLSKYYYKLQSESDSKYTTLVPKNIGNYNIKAVITETSNTLNGEAISTFNINKMKPTYTIPTGLSGVINSKLSTVILPEGFEWENPNEVLTAVGSHSFKAKFTPNDTDNYNIVNNIDVFVEVRNPKVNILILNESEEESNNDYVVNNNDDYVVNIATIYAYKLKSIKVNGIEKIANIIDNKLTIANVTNDLNVIIQREKIIYKIVEGNDQSVALDNTKNARFKINGDFSLFEEVYINDVLLDQTLYTVEEGSTILNLKKEYLNTLSIGKYNIRVLYSDGGEALGTFNINETSVNPGTNDNLISYLIIFGISSIGLATALLLIKKKKITK